MALEAVTECLKASEWEPVPAAIRETYRRVRERHEKERQEQMKKLDEVRISDEETADNLRRIREYAAKIGIGGGR